MCGGGFVVLTPRVKDELASTVVHLPSARKAEVTALLQFAGGLRVANGRVVIDADVDRESVASRVCRDLKDLCGSAPEVRVLPSVGSRRRYLVHVAHQAEDVARWTGLIDRWGRPVRGMPAQIVGGSRADAEAVWRGAFLARGSLSLAGRARGLEVECPGMEAALALTGAARRLGIHVKARQLRGADRVTVRDPDTISSLLNLIGAKQTHAVWQSYRDRGGTATAGAALVDSNQRRAQQSAMTTAIRAQRALEILGDKAPDHFVEIARLRIQHPDLSLEDLGRLAEPPLTKHAAAGRLRRVLGMADREAQRAGIADTSADVTPVGHPPRHP
ncbi:transcriptional regulator [Mycobacteroides abscessus subsp. abscessus]|nr:transcriptional regulator [Mycobacteroides abscessus subsp. abscessus]